jgi:PAS domain S-box-containing protein
MHHSSSSITMPGLLPGGLYQLQSTADGTVAMSCLCDSGMAVLEIPSADQPLQEDLWMKGIPSHDVVAFRTSLQESGRSLQPWYWQGYWRTTTGELRWLQWAAQPYRQEQSTHWSGMVMVLPPPTAPQAVSPTTHQHAHTPKAHHPQFAPFHHAPPIATSLSPESFRFLETVLDTIPIPVFYKDLNGIYLGCNQSFATYSGIPKASLIGRSIHDIAPDDLALVYTQMDQQLFRQGGIKVAEGKMIHADGSARDVVIHKAVLPNADGTPAGIVGVLIDTSERKLAERTLAEREILLRTILDSSPQSIFWKDRSGVFLGCNRPFAIAAGLDHPSAIVGKTDWDMPWSDVAEVNRAEEQSIMETCQACLHQERERHIPASNTQWVQMSLVPLRDTQGQVMGILGVWDDITARKQAELALQQVNRELAQLNQDLEGRVERRTQELLKSKAQLHKLAANIPGVIYQFQLNANEGLSCLYASDRCRELFELEPQEMDHWLSRVHPDDAAVLQDLVNRSALTMEWLQQELRITLPSGIAKWVQAIAQPERQSDGRIVWDALLIDISDRKQAEKELRKSEARFRAIFHHAGIGIMVTRPNGDLLEANPAALRLYGYTEEEFRQKRDADYTHPSDLKLDQKLLNRVLAGDFDSYQLEKRYIRQDGQVVWGRMTLTSVRDDRGELQYIVRMAEDISDRKQAEKEQERLIAILEATPDFVGIADATGAMVYLNQAARRMMQIRPAEDISRLHLLHFLAESVEEQFTHDILPQAIRGGVWTGETLLQYRNEEPIVTSQVFVAHKGEDGDIDFISTIARDIRDRKQAEAALRQREEFLRSIHDYTEQGIFVVDVVDYQFIYQSFNPVLERLTGCSAEQVHGKTPIELFGSVTGQKFLQNYQRCLQLGISISYEELVVFDNRDIWFLTTLSPIRDTNGQIYRLIGSVLDINDRKQAEEALYQSQTMLRLVIDSIPHRIFWKDENLVYMGCNQLQAEFVGFSSPEEIIGKTDFDMPWPRETIEFFRECDRQVILNDRSEYRILESHPQPDGSIRWFESNKVPLHDAHGRVIGVLGNVQDITERLLAEEELRKSQQKLALLIQQTPAAVIEWNPEFEITEWNPAAERIFGYTRTEILGYDAGFLIPNDVKPAIEQLRQDLLAQRGGTHSINRNITKDGRIIVCDWYHTSIVAPGGEVIAIASLAFDITDKFEAEAALRESEALLRQQKHDLEQTLQELQTAQMQLVQSEKMSSLGQLVAGVAHEINNPVNFIYGNLTHATEYVQDLMHLIISYQTAYPTPYPQIQTEIDEIDLDFLLEDLPKLLNSMKVGSDRIREIVRSLRNFSRLDEAEVKAVNIHEGIDSTLMILQNRLKPKSDHPGIVVVRDYGNLPPVECYAGQLNQVFMNILGNAIDALEEWDEQRSPQELDTHPSQIIIRTVCHQNHAEIHIIDNGPGMEEVVRKRLFDPFFTTKPVGKGTGLGMSISHQIVVDKHRGELVCHSTIGKGTEFIIRIPLRHPNLKS